MNNNWIQFEHEIQQLVEAFGYQAVTTPPSGDFGVDVIAFNRNRKVVVQCKLYGRSKVGGPAMMKLVGSREYFHASDAICITTSGFTKQAIEIASKQDVKLVDCQKLMDLCRRRNLTVPSLTALIAPDGSSIQMRENRMTIGRDINCDLIVRSPGASRRHARLVRCGLYLSLEDLNSSNGTFVNQRRLLRPVPINYGDCISISGYCFTVAMETPAGLMKLDLPAAA